ncbi:hypothetical protein CF327_g346 [Tilletia walkeri]|nr:hypothetical protein CF327_g346 [Tilletia walkeri]
MVIRGDSISSSQPSATRSAPATGPTTRSQLAIPTLQDIPNYSDQPDTLLRGMSSSEKNPEQGTAPPDTGSSAAVEESKPITSIEDLAAMIRGNAVSAALTASELKSELKSDFAQLRGTVLTRLDDHDQAVADLGRRVAALETAPSSSADSGGAFIPTTTVASGPSVSFPATGPVPVTPYMGQAAVQTSSSATQPSSAPSLGRVGLGLASQPWQRSDVRASSVPPGDARMDIRDDTPSRSAAEDSYANEKVLFCKPERLGEFHGDPLELEFWIGCVHDIARSNPSRAWQAAVRAAIPSALRGDAREWHIGLTDDEVRAMPDLSAYFQALRANFPVNPIELRVKALGRKWEPTKETSLGYSQVKVRMLRQAAVKGTPEETIVNDVLDGLVPSFQQILRLPRGKDRTVQALRAELGEQEPIWRKIHKVGVGDAGGMHTATFAPSPGTYMRQESPSVFATEQRRFFQYDPSRVVEAKDGVPRQYRKENGRVLRLNRPCGKCGQQHFDFEHTALAEVPKAYPLVESLDYEEVDELERSGF